MKSPGMWMAMLATGVCFSFAPRVSLAQAPTDEERPIPAADAATASDSPASTAPAESPVTPEPPSPSGLPEGLQGVELKSPFPSELWHEETQPKNDRPRLEASLKEGVLLRTYDNKAEVKLGASVQFDSRGYFTPNTAAPSSFDIRTARFELTSKFYDLLVIRFQAAFEDQPYIRNALVEIVLHESFHLSAGQMKVPFGTAWITADNHPDFLERASAEPVYPGLDRGVMIWGDFFEKSLTYNLGVFDGSGMDTDTNKGDIDDFKDVAARLFAQPFATVDSPYLKNIYLVAQGTYGKMSAPTKRFETRGLVAADYESQVWRWRTEQTLGTDGRNTDQLVGRIDSRARVGAEAHYILKSFAFSAEWARVMYQGIDVQHQFWAGTKRLKNDGILSRDATIDSVSLWASYFFTGESKSLDNFGWRQPLPKDGIDANNRGWGAWELLGRFSATQTSKSLFDTVKVNGYAAGDFSGTPPALVGGQSSATATVVDGAPLLYEASLGLNWTMNYNLRVLATATYLWAPDYKKDASGVAHYGLVSGGNSESAYPLQKNRLLRDELMIGLRLIMRI